MSAPRDPGRRRRAALVLMLLSGFSALGLQIVWTQQATLWLGHESAAVLAVVAAFFGGLALGALALAPRLERSARPARAYALCEAAIGLWALVLVAAMDPLTRALLALIGDTPSAGRQWAVAFAGLGLLLLPATLAMGATLPALTRAVSTHDGTERSHTAWPWLYAANTAGAMVGVLAAVFWLVPGFGLLRTAALCAVTNLVCAALTLRLLRGQTVQADTTRQADQTAPALVVLAATGALGIGYEVMAVRVLSQVTENTVYTFALLLAVYLAGTATGAAAYARLAPGAADAAVSRHRLLTILAAACGLGMLALWHADTALEALRGHFGPGVAAALAAEAVLALAAFAPPTLVMGALFSHLCHMAHARGLGYGQALGWNTLGAALAPPLFGVVLAPVLGAKGALLGVVAGYAILATLLATNRARTGMAAAVALGATALWAPPLVFVQVPEGGQVLSYQEGILGAVSVVEDARGDAVLRINNRQQEGSTATWTADARQALLPLLLHPAPGRVLFLGLGTGVTARTAAADPSLHVQAVELLPEVVAASAHFTAGQEAAAQRLHVAVADARRQVRTSDTHWDVVVSDNFHPARSGSAALYTVEHFQAVRSRLASGGIFCQWLPLHQLDLATLQPIVRAFLTAFPQGAAMLATLSLDTPVIGLVGRADEQPFDFAALAPRLASTALPAREAGLTDALALAGSFVAGPQALRTWAGDGPVNSDDHPLVAYLAPQATYAPQAPPRDHLLQLLSQWSWAPAELWGPDVPAANHLAAYVQARNAFLRAGRNVRPLADVRAMLAQVQGPLLEVLLISPDFRPAYDPLLRMAQALAPQDRAAARSLLTRLAAIQPARPEASAVLTTLPEP